MSVTVIVGAQYGGEGKGRVCASLGRSAELSVRGGGPNSAHVVRSGGKKYIFRCLPASALSSPGLVAIGPAGVIDVALLKQEISDLGLQVDRIRIDRRALVLEERHRESRKASFSEGLSTGVGVGAAVAEHVLRDPRLKRAGDVPELAPFLCDVAELIHDFARSGRNVLVLGNQGFGLSLYHGDYPFVTNRDTTAATACATTGVAIREVSSIVLVVRTFPIRSQVGNLPSETSWEEISARAGSLIPIEEHTSFGGLTRRVAFFDESLFRRACILNGPTEIALNFVDHLDWADRGRRRYADLGARSREFIAMLERIAGVPVTMIGTSEQEEDFITRVSR